LAGTSEIIYGSANRTFIKENYATYDEKKKQYYLTFNDGRIEYFPDRIAKEN
jgi:hypothetical protein